MLLWVLRFGLCLLLLIASACGRPLDKVAVSVEKWGVGSLQLGLSAQWSYQNYW